MQLSAECENAINMLNAKKATMKQQPHRNTVTSILDRQAKLTNRIDKLQLQVYLLNDNVQLSQFSSRERDDVSLFACREN